MEKYSIALNVLILIGFLPIKSMLSPATYRAARIRIAQTPISSAYPYSAMQPKGQDVSANSTAESSRLPFYRNPVYQRALLGTKKLLYGVPEQPKPFVPYTAQEMKYDMTYKDFLGKDSTWLKDAKNEFTERLISLEKSYREWYEVEKTNYDQEQAENAKKWFFVSKSHKYENFEGDDIKWRIQLVYQKNAINIIDALLDASFPSVSEMKILEKDRELLQQKLGSLKRKMGPLLSSYNLKDNQKGLELRFIEMEELITQLEIIDIQIGKGRWEHAKIMLGTKE